MRVVSLDPAWTDMLCAIGAGSMLVARSSRCDAPGTGEVPVASDDAASSFGPDLVLVGGAPDADGRLARDPRTVEDVYDDMLRLGRAVGRERDAMHAVVALRDRADRLLEHVNPYDDGALVAVLESVDPLRAAGLWSAQLVERAGGRHPLNPCVARPGSGSAAGPQMAERIAGPAIAIVPEILEALDPDRVIVAPDAASIDDATAHATRLSGQPGVGAWLSGRSGGGGGARVAVVAGAATFHRNGPGLIDTLAFLVGWLNDRPELIPAGYPWRALG